ncbi:MAG: hypothetical protein IK117_05840 [Bacteroidales bacterium]|nr:hypothetical protein [Bacteroidales bacterium]
MKKISVLLVLLCIATHLFAQSDIKIVAFTADAPFQSITVRNNSTLESVTLNYPDTLLTFSVPQGMEETGVETVSKQTFLHQKTRSSVVVSVNKSGQQRLRLVDLAGKVVCRTEVELPEGEHEFEISAPKAGLYVLQVENSEQKTSLKLNLEKSALAQIEYSSSTMAEYQLKSLADLLSYTPSTEYTIMCVSKNGKYILSKKQKIRFAGGKTVVELKFLPTLQIPTVQNVTKTEATLQCNVTEDADMTTETERGFYVGGTFYKTEGLTNPISVKLSDLHSGNHYWVKPYVKNEEFTKFGPEIEFYTEPNVTTEAASNVAYSSATLNGSYQANSSVVSQKGFCWATTKNPTIEDSKANVTTDGFVYTAENLIDGTTYYVRAFVVINNNVYYGSEGSFVTKQITPPSVTTVEVTDVTTWGATAAGNVESEGDAAVVERGFCWSTNQNPTVDDSKKSAGSGKGNFSVSIKGLHPQTIYYIRAYAMNSVGKVIYGESEVFKTKQIPTGTVAGLFSISNSKQIYFSQGNLQYQASTGTWRFAEHQYDIIGKDNANISSTNSGWIDLFGWGTSGYNGKNPYMTSMEYSDYGDGSNDITGSDYDWGVYNAISNGGNQAGQWRTLTYDEWSYLIYDRAQASRLMGEGRVNNVNGLILLPDGWETPSSVKFTYDPGNYSTNVYSQDEWAVMQSYGAVFLPAAGYRYGTDVYNVGSGGYYWSSSAKYNYPVASYYLGFGGYGVYAYDDYYDYRGDGQSVRLVQEVK